MIVKNTLIIAILLSLMGCAPAPFDYSHNQQSPMGIKVRVEAGAEPLPLAVLDEYYRVVSQCVMGSTPTPFFLVVISGVDVINEFGTVSDGTIDYALRMPIITFRNIPGGDAFALAVFTHELVHGLLWLQVKSTAHSMSEFDRCSFL